MKVVKVANLDETTLSDLADELLRAYVHKGAKKIALQFKRQSDFERYIKGLTTANLGHPSLREAPHEITEEQMLRNILHNRDNVDSKTSYNPKKRQVIYDLSLAKE